MKLKNSAIIYEGESLIDKEPVVAVATGFVLGANSKLGANVIQVWVMRSDISPVEAIKTGQDYSVCGNCPLRGKVCYVNVAFAPSSIYYSYKAGNYPHLCDRHLQKIKEYRKLLRLTAYGDIAAIPIEAVKPLIDAAPVTVGYTHQWSTHPQYKGLLMASCENPEDAIAAKNMGWQTFRIKNSKDPLLWNEKQCSNQLHKSVQCEDCKLCDGKSSAIAVDVHGLNWKKNNYQKLLNI